MEVVLSKPKLDNELTADLESDRICCAKLFVLYTIIRVEQIRRMVFPVKSSVADPERFDADPDPDPTLKADADPDPNPFTRVKKNCLQIFNYCFQSLPKLVIVIFSVKMREEGLKGEG